MHQWSRYIQGRDYFMAPLAEGTDYEIVKDEREDARATTGALVHEMQPLFFTPGKSDWNTFEMIRSFAARGENVAGLNANTDGAYAIGSNRNTEIHTFQIRHGMDPEIATIQWEMLSNAEFSVAIPLYSALLTEVSPYFSDQDVSFDHCEEEDVVNNEEPKNSINYVLMDINTLAYENRDHCATGVRAYLDALQKELIEQNLTVDEAMQAEEGTEARTALANKAGKAATKNTYVKCKACSRRCATTSRRAISPRSSSRVTTMLTTTAWSSPSPTPTRPFPMRTWPSPRPKRKRSPRRSPRATTWPPWPLAPSSSSVSAPT